MTRPNPADEDAALRKLVSGQQYLFQRVARAAGDAITPGDGSPGGQIGSFIRDPTNPHVWLYISDEVDPADHIHQIPISSQLVPDPANPKLYRLPNNEA